MHHDTDCQNKVKIYQNCIIMVKFNQLPFLPKLAIHGNQNTNWMVFLPLEWALWGWMLKSMLGSQKKRIFIGVGTATIQS